MSNENFKKEDANNFYGQLLKKINNPSNEKDYDGKKIKKYLEFLIPEWENIKPTRLYNHIQKMHENAEEIRRFEIDLTWRRALYFIPLVVIFFSAFGVAFFSFQSEFGIDNNKFILIDGNDVNIKKGKIKILGYIASDYGDGKSIKNKEFTYKNKDKLGHLILLGIAFVNACLCFFLTKMNIESQRWQKNWECHMDYLQQILGFKLMQTCLRPRGGYFSIRTTNTWIGFLTFLVWYFTMVLLFYSLLDINIIFQSKHYKSLCYIFSSQVCDCILILALILFFTSVLVVVFVVAKDVILSTPLIGYSIVLPILIFILPLLIIQISVQFLTPIFNLNYIIILTLISTSIIVSDIYYYLAGEYIWKGFEKDKKVSISGKNKLYIRDLEITEEEFNSIGENKDKKCNRYIIIIFSPVIIFSIPFIILITSYLIEKSGKIELTPNLMIIFAILIPFISPSVKSIIEYLRSSLEKINFM